MLVDRLHAGVPIIRASSKIDTPAASASVANVWRRWYGPRFAHPGRPPVPVPLARAPVVEVDVAALSRPGTAAACRASAGARRAPPAPAAVSGTRRRRLRYGVSMPSRRGAGTITARCVRSMSRRSSAIHSFVRSPVSAANDHQRPVDRPELVRDRVDLLAGERPQLLGARLGVAPGLDAPGCAACSPSAPRRRGTCAVRGCACSVRCRSER